MIKKLTLITTAIIFILLSFISCSEKPAAPKAGSAKALDMLSLLPKDTRAVFFLDFHQMMSIEAVSKAIQEDENKINYQEFITKTGIDPQKDIYFIAGALSGEMEKTKQKALVIINLKYNKDTLFSLISEKIGKEAELQEQEYNGFKIYTLKKGEQGFSFSFIDESNIFAGDEIQVKSGIDVLRRKEENVFKNEALSALITKTNKEAIFWGAVVVPPGVMDEVMTKAPLEASALDALKAVSAASLYLDYRNKNIMAEIKFMSSDASKNQAAADYLNQIKTLGAMVTIQDFNLGEVLNRIEITSEPDHVRIYISIPENFINELSAKLKKPKPSEQPAKK